MSLTTPKLEARVRFRDADGYLRHGVLKTVALGWARIDGDDGKTYRVEVESIIGKDTRTQAERERLAATKWAVRMADRDRELVEPLEDWRNP